MSFPRYNNINNNNNNNAVGDLWTDEQHRMIANWDSILRRWDQSLQVPTYVRTALENLRMASDLHHPHNPPLTHFLRYFSYEDSALKWFVYETIAVEWLWGNKRMDYLQGVLPRIDLDTQFPFFPGSPQNRMTIRQFLLHHLNSAELRSLPGVVPPLPATPPPSPTLPAEQVYPRIVVRLLRKPPMNSAKKDDVLTISRNSNANTYLVRYQDKESKTSVRSMNLTRNELLNYFSIIFRMMQEDEDPFDSVQVLFPSMPSILFGAKSLDSSNRDLIYEGLSFTLDNWPSC